jgi:hypothetical protein
MSPPIYFTLLNHKKQVRHRVLAAPAYSPELTSALDSELRAQGRHEEALPFAEKALRLGEREFGPDQIVEARAESCPCCVAALAEGDQKLLAVYQWVELPPIKPIVTQVRVHGGTCPDCGEAFTARPPPGLEPRSPPPALTAAGRRASETACTSTGSVRRKRFRSAGHSPTCSGDHGKLLPISHATGAYNLRYRVRF